MNKLLTNTRSCGSRNCHLTNRSCDKRAPNCHGTKIKNEQLAYARRVVQHKANQIVRRSRFTRSDRDDIEQQLLLDILRRWQSFDPTRSKYTTFITRLVNHESTAMLRSGSVAGGRSLTNCQSIHEKVSDGDGAELATMVSEDANNRRLGICIRRNHNELNQDVDAVVQTMPEDLREISELLMDQSISAVVDQLDMSRTTLYRRISLIRKYFEDADLQKYLRTRGQSEPWSSI